MRGRRKFLRCEKKYIAFGGARGGGKSWAVRCKAKLLALRYPGIRLLLVRRTLPEIEANHLTFLRRELAGAAAYRAGERRFVFVNGSSLQFGYCGSDRDAERYQGAEYDVIFFDEATQLQERWMRQLAACVRGVNGFPKRIYYTCNPGGPGHGYIKRLFIDRRYEPGENGEDYVFIPARGDGQPGAAGAAAGVCEAAGGAAAQAARGVAGGQVGRAGGTGVSGVYGRPGAL